MPISGSAIPSARCCISHLARLRNTHFTSWRNWTTNTPQTSGCVTNLSGWAKWNIAMIGKPSGMNSGETTSRKRITRLLFCWRMRTNRRSTFLAVAHTKPGVVLGLCEQVIEGFKLVGRLQRQEFGGSEAKGQESCRWPKRFFAWMILVGLIKSTRHKMSESKQPFTEHVTKAKRGPDTSRLGWIAAGIMAVLVVVLLLLWASAVGKQRGLESLRSKLDEANASLAGALDENQKNKDQITALQTQVADLEKEKEAAAQMAKGLEDEMRSALESKDVTISNLQGKLTVNILDRVMFDSGEAILKPAGESVMRKIAAILAGHPRLKIHVIGHTDNVPIRPEARNRFASNWELSTARALAAVHFLTEKAGVDPHRVGAIGYGEYRPLADNATVEGRARNRRIAITILPDELAEADTVPAVKPGTSIDSQPQARRAGGE